MALPLTLDAETERALLRLARREGRTAEEVVRELIHEKAGGEAYGDRVRRVISEIKDSIAENGDPPAEAFDKRWAYEDRG